VQIEGSKTPSIHIDKDTDYGANWAVWRPNFGHLWEAFRVLVT
jgi:hypothetical protein